LEKLTRASNDPIYLVDSDPIELCDLRPRHPVARQRADATELLRPATIATLVFALSAVAGGLFGFTAMFPYIAVLGLSLIAGFVVQGNFSNLTSGVLAVAAPRYRGATIGLYSCIGFGAGFLGTLLFGVTLDQFGGTSHLAAWVLSFGTCGLACLAGAAATVFLPRNIWQR
jgi:hypothetical protein